jgi:hypothetical protein
MGRSYERETLFGLVEAKKTVTHSSIVVRDAIGHRAKVGDRFSLAALQLPLWSAKGARVLATFEDGSPAITSNTYGTGMIVTVLSDAWTAAQSMPDLVRDVLEYANTARGAKPLVDIVGTKETSDVAVQHTSAGFRVAVVNHDTADIEVLLIALTRVERGEWVDLVQPGVIGNSKDLKLKVPAHGFRAIELR